MANFPFTEILGIKIHAMTLNNILGEIRNAIKKEQRLLIFPMNIHILVELNKNPEILKYHKRADVIFADGVPLVWLSRLTRFRIPDRVSGTDLVEQLLKTEKRIFLLGSSPEVLSLMRQKYKSAYQGGALCGTYSPPFSYPWTKSEHLQIIQAINKAKPHILLVGLTPLKQERWLLSNFTKINATIGIAVGSAFDILSGKTPRAPSLLQVCGLEWLWRIALEPKRLFLRYIRDAISLVRLLFG